MKDKRVWVEQNLEDWLKTEPKEKVYYLVKFKSSNIMQELMFEGDAFYDNEWDRTYDLYQITHVLVSKPLKEVIQEIMPSEELYKAVREFMATVNVRFPNVSIDDPKSMACYEAYHKLSKLLGE